MRIARLILASVAAVSALTGCAYVAVHVAPSKVASKERTPSALRADEHFWEALHGGKYEDIGSALESLTAAYLGDPGDATTAARIGWLHIWRLSERDRQEAAKPTITDDAVLARKYFSEANRMVPEDARFLGFLASSLLAEGDIHKDESVTREGYYKLLDSIDAWPEFNLFTAGYVLSTLPMDSPRYKKAVEWQWETLDRCFGQKVDRNTADFGDYMSLATTQGPKRACWNSWIAPHNFEGFFLNMGDMLVKSGEWQSAQKIYASARLSKTYGQWKYRDVLERRILDAKANVEFFRGSTVSTDPIYQKMMVRTSFACVACHQN